MERADYDFFVIGAGSGGVRAARIAASLGAKVGICEDARLGGTCVNVGCVPKKLFVYGASYADAFHEAAGYGWTLGSPAFSWNTLRDRKDGEIHRLNGAYQRLLEAAGVTIHHGRGRFVDAHTLRVGDREVSARHVLVATGGRPVVPRFPGADLLAFSDDFFTLPELPRRLVIIGGGYIGAEFAGIFGRLGVQVSLVHRWPLLLPDSFDDDVREAVGEGLAASGVRLHLHRQVSLVEKRGDSVVATLDDGLEIEADMVACACGRVPNTDGLGLEAAGVALREGGAVAVDEHLRTSVEHIYAVGDVAGGDQLTPVALAQGQFVARRLFAGDDKARPFDPDIVPTAVFTNPTVGTVGLGEAAARKTHEDVRVYKSSFTPMRHTLSGVFHKTFVKVVVDGATDRVLGFHMVGEEAGEIVQGLAVALTCGVTKAQLDATLGIHPTAAEEFVTLRTAVS
ncbi:MAG: glutathione-disulfide reductase [Deltaproteobacteria bacterium]|nr:glutathione-disulfide reductase [Deltaproteobacteria bacterium]